MKVEKKQKKVQRLLMVIKRAQQIKKPHLFNKPKSHKPAKKESRKKHKAHKGPVKKGSKGTPKQREAAKKKEAGRDYKFDLRRQIAQSRADENDQKAYANKYVHKKKEESTQKFKYTLE